MNVLKILLFFVAAASFLRPVWIMQVSGKMRLQVKDAEGDYGAFAGTLGFGYKQYICVKR